MRSSSRNSGLPSKSGNHPWGANIAEHLRQPTAPDPNDEYLRLLVENSPLAMVVSGGMEEQVLFINKKFHSLFGYTLEDIPLMNHWWSLACPDMKYREGIHIRWTLRVEKAIRERGAIEPMEATVRCKDGSFRYIEFHLSSIGPRNLITLVDLTERLRMEQVLRDSEQQLEVIFDNARDGILVADVETQKFVTGNAAIERMLGYNANELRQIGVEDIHPPKSLAYVKEQFGKQARGEIELASDIPVQHRDGTIFYADINASRITVAERPCVIGIFRDVTERKQAEAKLKLFRTLLDNSGDAIQVIDPTTLRFLDVNEQECRDLGYSRDELLSMSVLDIDPGFGTADKKMIDEQIRKSGVALFERRHRRKDGSTFPVEIGLKFVELDRPYVLTIARDITERRRAEAEQARLATIIEQAAETIVITDLKATIIYANPAFERITGYSRAEAVGQNPRILQSGRQDAAFYRQMWDTLTRGEVWHGHFINKRKDGTFYEEDAVISPIRDATGTVINYAAVKRDVTREVQLEHQMQQVQKIDAVGRLAGGVAHDFNNILQVILGLCEVILCDMSIRDIHRQDVLDILKSAQHASDLTRQLLAFSRRQTTVPKVLDVNSLVDNIQKMLKRLIGEDIQLVIPLAPHPLFLKADAGQIEQVIMNLAVNARDAMPHGGQLTIATDKVTLTERDLIAFADGRPGEFIRLTVTDTGSGMTPEILTHIFEPFFTTKGPNKGTGLGLAVIYGIVKQHNGWIHVETQVGRGATFAIYLPAHLAGPEETAPVNSSATMPPPQGHGEYILVVEDQAEVRHLSVRVLREAGYHVVTAKTAQSAQQFFKKEAPHYFDLVFSDVVLPDQNGIELAEKLLEQQPDIAILLCSGYTDERIHNKIMASKGIHFLQKPYTYAALLHLVRQILDTRCTAG